MERLTITLPEEIIRQLNELVLYHNTIKSIMIEELISNAYYKLPK